MKVKLTIKSDSELVINFNKKDYSVKYSSDDRDIFNDINKQIIEYINSVDEVELIYEENKSMQYKVAHKISSTYKNEINNIRNKIFLPEVTFTETQSINSKHKEPIFNSSISQKS